VYGGSGIGNLAASTVFVLPAGGGMPVMVSDSTTLNVSPVWLPDGKALLFLSSGGGGRDVYLQRIGRGGRAEGLPRRVTTGLDAHTIALSKDGKRLVYSKYTRDMNIWMVRLPASGSASAQNAVQITRGNQSSEILRLSPDGKWLVYDSDLNGNGDLFIVPSDGGTPRQLTDDPADDLAPDWSPDGTQIVFHSFRTGNRDVFTVNADGTGLAQVTTDTLSDWYAVWGPDENTLAFSRGEGDALTILQVRRASKSAPWGAPTPLGRGIVNAMNRARQVYVSPAFDTTALAAAVPADGSPAIPLFHGPPWFGTSWVRMSPDGQTLYASARDSSGVPSFWAVDLRTQALRRLLSLDRPDMKTTRGPFDTDGKRLYFVAGEHQADIWIADVEKR
jgi:Tol biopolymer transport system component